MSELHYGFAGDEQLRDDPDEVVQAWMENDVVPCESFDVWATYQEWPIKVSVFRHMKPTPGTLASTALDDVLIALDEEYGDPGGDETQPTEAMKAAAKAFVDAVLSEYVVWSCEPTGEVVEYTQEEARKLWEGLE